MAVHDFECPKCGEMVTDIFLTPAQLEDYFHWCPKCLAVMEQSFKNYKGWKPFRPYIDQHIAETPVEITSREQRRDLMKKNSLVDPAVGQGEPGCMV